MEDVWRGYQMSTAWDSTEPPVQLQIRPLGWGLAVVRALMLALLVFGGLILLLLIRLIERPIYGQSRPVTPYITQGVCRGAFVIMGLKHIIKGEPMRWWPTIPVGWTFSRLTRRSGFISCLNPKSKAGRVSAGWPVPPEPCSSNATPSGPESKRWFSRKDF